jgi:tetratricopeptide (TPR) repeat protein
MHRATYERLSGEYFAIEDTLDARREAPSDARPRRLPDRRGSRRHPWVRLPDSIQQFAPELRWDSARPLYEAGEYADAAAKGRELIEARPNRPYLYFNTACCESLAGQTAEAVEHLRQAIDMWDGCREMAKHESDLDAIRHEPAFQALVG